MMCIADFAGSDGSKKSVSKFRYASVVNEHLVVKMSDKPSLLCKHVARCRGDVEVDVWNQTFLPFLVFASSSP